MAKKITLETLAAQLSKMDARIERGFVAADNKFAALADDVADLRTELKTDIVRVGEQVISIETQLRGMKHTKLHARVADLEAKIFGATRA
jgi:hypothetical protein